MHELAFNWVVVTYFFLGGMSAGSFLLSVAANYWLTDYKPIAKKAAIASFVSLAMGLIFLLALVYLTLGGLLFTGLGSIFSLIWAIICSIVLLGIELLLRLRRL